MKKVLLIVAFFTSLSPIFAQIKLGGQIGGNIGYQKNRVSMATENSSKLVGLVLGVVADIELKKQWSFRPELNYTQKGFVYKNTDNNIDFRGSLYYLEIPMNITYNIKSSLGKVIIGAGPSIGYGVYGKITEAGNTYYPKFDGKNESNHYKKFDFGMNIMLGYQFNSGTFFTVGYNNGLTDVDTNLGDNAEVRNKAFVIKFGYMLGKKK